MIKIEHKTELSEPKWMVESLFSRSYAIGHHRSAPFLLQRQAYLRYLSERGLSRKGLIDTAQLLLHVIRVMQPSECQTFDRSEIKEGGRRWADEILTHRGASRKKKSALRFNTAANGWFEYIGLLRKPTVLPFQFDSEIADFATFLRKATRYTPITIQGIEGPTKKFLHWFADRHNNLALVSYHDFDAYMDCGRMRGWRPCTVASQSNSLRAFFRYAETRGWCRLGISKTIVNPINRMTDWEVAGPSWKDVRRLIETTGESTQSRARAKAVILLCAIYGLRNSELGQLQLNDFNWYDETLLIKRSKRGPRQRLPLVSEVGEAVIQYLRMGRPHSSCHNLFLTLRPPFGPLKNFAPIVQSRMKKAGITSPTYGTHGLRHACATELLRQGASLQGIAALLGHRDIRSVSVYAKCDDHAMQDVARFDLSDVL